MLGRLGILLGLLALPVTVAGEPQQEVMLHVYPRDGVFHYAPASIEVLPNATVVLGHLYGRHSLTSAEGLFNATGDGTAWPTIRAPSTPGTYRFYCWIHATPQTTPESGMAGDLVVVSPSGAPALAAREAPAPAMSSVVAASGLLLGALAHRRAKDARSRDG
ncbi:MAG TPA: hypothetical protein VM327_01650 [Candidatus Thermoplasmatota archaeon]|nr:hypothetical protein [Candidatus Thermoplasmatota archaeon]